MSATSKKEALKLSESVSETIQEKSFSVTTLLRICARIAELLNVNDILWINNVLRGYPDDDVPSYRLIEANCHYKWKRDLSPIIYAIRENKKLFFKKWKQRVVIRTSSIMLESHTTNGFPLELGEEIILLTNVVKVAFISSRQTWEILHRITDKIREFVSKVSINLRYGKRTPKISVDHIKPIQPLEDIVASGLSRLGYQLVDRMNATPSGLSVDFVVKQKDKLIGVEVKNRKVDVDDLKNTIVASKDLALNNIMIVSSKGFTNNTKKHAREMMIELVSFDDILKMISKEKLPTSELEQNITNLTNFVNNRPKPTAEQLNSFKDSLEKVFSAKTNVDKKVSLEGLAKILMNMIEGLKVFKTNVNTKTEEIDLLVKNENKDPFWQRLPSPFLVECKNWSKPVTAKEIRDFDGKMREITFRIMIAVNGITGRSERDAARGVIRDARIKKRQIIVLDNEDLKDIAAGTLPAEKINAKFYELYRI